MLKRFLLLFLLAFLPAIITAQTGKIVGKVTDLQTGEPLIGASVIVEGTSLGAATNANGEYVILNVSPGSYTVKGRYIGYREVTMENIKVSVNLTTEVNFELPSEAYQTETVTVVAPKPLINKNTTNATSIVRSEDIENIPIRGVNAIVATQAGVVEQGGGLYVRGSRADGVAYYVDGVLVNNPVFGGSRTQVINNAVEEIQFQAGGYSAEFGGANGGIVSTQTRAGAENYNVSFEGITDQFVETGKKFLGTYSYGQAEYVFTAGGPIIPGKKNLKFFFAGNNNFRRSPVGFFQGMNFENLVDDATGDTFDLYYPDGITLNNHQNTYQAQGNITWDLNPFTIRINGGFTYTEGHNGVGRTDYLNKARAGMNQGQTITSSLKLTHVLSPNSFYDVILNVFSDFYLNMDEQFKHNIALYGDSLANSAIGSPYLRDGDPLDAYQSYSFSFNHSDQVYDLYQKQKTLSYGGKVNFLYQAGLHHELKFGGEYTYYTIRRYSYAPEQLAANARAVADGSVNRVYSRLDNYGYDVYGNQSDDELTKGRHPVFAALYFQDKIEFPDLVINAGIRLDYINTNSQTFKNPQDIEWTSDDLLDPEGLVNVDPLLQLSPRLGFSFPVTDQTVFHAQYGKFVQQSRLRDIYTGWNVIADNIKGGYAITNPVGFGLKPERTTSYEIGFKQQIGEIFAFDITGFYKDIKEQIQIRQIYGAPNTATPTYYAYMNGDFSTIKGVELKLDLRRTERITASIDYTYSDAQGTGSNPSSGFRQIWQSPTSTPFFPMQIAPLDFNQAHRGYVNIDYRFANDDGPEVFGSKILENFGINFLFSFNSGFNFTRWEGYGNSRTPLEPLNASTTPWNYQIDARLDKSVMIGPLDVNIYVWVTNLLNTENVIAVFNNTGDAYDNGYLSDPLGVAQTNGYRLSGGEAGAKLFQDLYKAINYASGNFGTPRQIKLGIRINY
ncbi:MAG: TonB-dependent receptor [Ignavibacteriales bacterium]|nr:MAG: TonB-dependent receptor [Ignavibacteriales bacterium]